MDSSSMHGYLLHSIVNRIVGPTRKISWGVLYPLIHGLLAEGLIDQAPDEEEAGREQGGSRGKKKKSYRITSEGRRRFYALMEEPIPYTTEYELHFYIKMANFDQIDGDLQLVALHQYKDFLRYLRRHHEETLAHVADEPAIEEGERVHIMSISEHRLAKLRFDEEWVLEQIKRMSPNNGR